MCCWGQVSKLFNWFLKSQIFSYDLGYNERFLYSEAGVGVWLKNAIYVVNKSFNNFNLRIANIYKGL